MRQGTEQGNQNRLMSHGEVQKPQDEEMKEFKPAFERLMERAFGKSSRISNIAITCGFAAFLAVAVLFVLCMATSGPWAGKCGIACLNVMFISCAIAFSAQKISQAVRALSALVAWIKGQKAPVFKEEEPYYGKLLKKAFKITKEKGTDLFRSIKTTACHRVSSVIVRARTNARAYRGARRPVFAHSSLDGGGGGSGDSGDSDSGDPPGPSHHPAPLKLSQPFRKESNSTSYRRRFSRAFGCWLMPHGERSGWRWSV